MRTGRGVEAQDAARGPGPRGEVPAEEGLAPPGRLGVGLAARGQERLAGPELAQSPQGLPGVWDLARALVDARHRAPRARLGHREREGASPFVPPQLDRLPGVLRPA